MRRVLQILVLLGLGLAPFAAAAQTSAANAAKYAELRGRLRSDFLVVGTEAGMSMPAHERWPDGMIRWADATIDLGWYIGVLATELHMRQSPEFLGFDGVLTEFDTVDELAAALLALQRLDEQGDAAFPECAGAPSLNGFFIRDDVGAGFHQNFADRTSTSSDFLSSEPTLKEMSQDQVYHVLMGLALVHALVPSEVSARGIALGPNAQEQAVRIIQKMADDSWLIQNPACDRDVARGPSAVAYSPATALAMSWFTGGAVVLETSAVAKGIWDLTTDPDSGFYQNVDNLHMAMAIAAVGQGWGDVTHETLVGHAASNRWYLYPLVNEVLHSNAAWCDTRGVVLDEARQMLDELPVGEFPHNPNPERAEHGFTQSNRFIRGIGQHYVGASDSGGREYHGLDYMLLHNTAAIADPAAWAGRDEPCSRGPEDMGTGGADVGFDAGGEPPYDAGPADLGTDVTPPDAGGGHGSADGCACTAVDTRGGRATPWAALFVGAAWARRRRRRQVGGAT